MNASITTEHGTYTGRTVESIIRREYGRSAIVHWSSDRNAPEAGMVLSGRPGQDGARVLATLRRAEGDRDTAAEDREWDQMLEDIEAGYRAEQDR